MNYFKISILASITCILVSSCNSTQVSGKSYTTMNSVVKSEISTLESLPRLTEILSSISQVYQSDTADGHAYHTVLGQVIPYNVRTSIYRSGDTLYTLGVAPIGYQTDTFHNLRIASSTKGYRVVELIEYNLSPTFASNYRDGRETLTTFSGSIQRYSLPELNTYPTNDLCSQSSDFGKLTSVGDEIFYEFGNQLEVSHFGSDANTKHVDHLHYDYLSKAIWVPTQDLGKLLNVAADYVDCFNQMCHQKSAIWVYLLNNKVATGYDEDAIYVANGFTKLSCAVPKAKFERYKELVNLRKSK